MLIAQALGEYGVVSAFVAGIRWVESGYNALEGIVGEWGVTGLGIAAGALAVFSLVKRLR